MNRRSGKTRLEILVTNETEFKACNPGAKVVGLHSHRVAFDMDGSLPEWLVALAKLNGATYLAQAGCT